MSDAKLWAHSSTRSAGGNTSSGSLHRVFGSPPSNYFLSNAHSCRSPSSWAGPVGDAPVRNRSNLTQRASHRRSHIGGLAELEAPCHWLFPNLAWNWVLFCSIWKILGAQTGGPVCSQRLHCHRFGPDSCTNFSFNIHIFGYDEASFRIRSIAEGDTTILCDDTSMVTMHAQREGHSVPARVSTSIAVADGGQHKF